jgi:hypothetical protein
MQMLPADVVESSVDATLEPSPDSENRPDDKHDDSERGGAAELHASVFVRMRSECKTLPKSGTG